MVDLFVDVKKGLYSLQIAVEVVVESDQVILVIGVFFLSRNVE